MLPDPSGFLARFFAALPGTPAAYDEFVLDHLCYRTASTPEYERLRDRLLAGGNNLLTEATVGGRPIATFRLDRPYAYRGRCIELLELPAPKPGRPYPTGWEHAEFVTDRPLADFSRYLTEKLGVDPADIDRKGLAKTTNRDLRLPLDNGMSVKFHEQSLDAVIAAELAAAPGGK